MAEVFLGSLMLVPYNFAPYGWAFCQGQLLSISQNTALFSLLGTYYGGDGKSNFALPNLQGAIPIGQGQGPGLSSYYLGQSGGSAAVTLVSTEVPAHIHNVKTAPTPGNTTSPNGAVFADVPIFTTDTTKLAQFNQAAILPAGGSQAHNNLMPYVTLNWIIALQGIFPARS